MSDKMVKCGTCQAEIAASAKTCPKCGASNKKKGGCLKLILISFGGIIVLSIIIAGASGEKKSESHATASASSSASTESQKPQEKTFKIGDTISTSELAIRVVSVQRKMQVGSEAFESKPAEGGVYVAIQWEYKNISKAPISSFSTPTLKLKDGNGTKYDSDDGATSSYATELNLTEKITSDLNPGIKVKGAEIFEVAAENLNKTGWKIFINSDPEIEIPLTFE